MKMMKKILALLLALSLLYTAAAVTAEGAAEETPEGTAETAQEDTVTEVSPGKLLGSWYGLTNGVFGEEYLSVGDTRVEFNRDKSGVLVINGQSFSFTWSVDSDKLSVKMKLDDSTAMDYNPYGRMNADGWLIVESIQDGTVNHGFKYSMTYIFVRENNTLQIPEMIAAAEEDEFYGNYQLLYIMDGGKVKAKVEDYEKVSARVDFAELEMTGTDRNGVFVTEFTDGKLLVIAEEEAARILRLDRSFSTLEFNKTTDERLVEVIAYDDSNNVGGVFYFQKEE